MFACAPVFPDYHLIISTFPFSKQDNFVLWWNTRFDNDDVAIKSPIVNAAPEDT